MHSASSCALAFSQQIKWLGASCMHGSSHCGHCTSCITISTPPHATHTSNEPYFAAAVSCHVMMMLGHTHGIFTSG